MVSCAQLVNALHIFTVVGRMNETLVITDGSWAQRESKTSLSYIMLLMPPQYLSIFKEPMFSDRSNGDLNHFSEIFFFFKLCTH